MLITGMLMLGKMSVGVRNSTNGVSSTITSANTINVYGRFRAKRTIHILVFEFLQPGKTWVPDLPVEAQQFSQLDRAGAVLVTPARTGNLVWYDTFFHRCWHCKPLESW